MPRKWRKPMLMAAPMFSPMAAAGARVHGHRPLAPQEAPWNRACPNWVRVWVAEFRRSVEQVKNSLVDGTTGVIIRIQILLIERCE